MPLLRRQRPRVTCYPDSGPPAPPPPYRRHLSFSPTKLRARLRRGQSAKVPAMWPSGPYQYSFQPRACHYPCPKCSLENSGDYQRQKEEKIKRPMNAFLVWSLPERKRLAKLYPSAKNVDISCMLGKRWGNMSKAERQPAVERAQQLKKEHQLEHPDYKYRPRRRRRSAPDHHMSDCVEHSPLVQFIPVEIGAFPSPAPCCFLPPGLITAAPRNETAAYLFNNCVSEEPRSAPPLLDNSSVFPFCSSVSAVSSPATASSSSFDVRVAAPAMAELDAIDTAPFAALVGEADPEAMLHQAGADLLGENISLAEDFEALLEDGGFP